MLRTEYGRDDIKPENEANKCNLCNFKYVVKTKCCDKPLCGFHCRYDGEYADQCYFSCDLCNETEHYGDDGFIVNKKNVYCEQHNELVFCEPCNLYYCKDHTKHECVEWTQVPNPVFTDEEKAKFRSELFEEAEKNENNND